MEVQFIAASLTHPKGWATRHPEGWATRHPEGWATRHPEGWATRGVWATVVLLLALLSVSSHADEQLYSDTFNIEIDYMVLRDSVGNIIHSHMPTPTEVQAVQQMFACQGILLNIVVDDEVPHIDILRRDPNDSTSFFNYYGADSYGAIKAAYRNYPICFHYCVFGHSYENSHYVQTSSSGLGEISGDEFIVTLGLWSGDTGTPFEKAATLAHEFGHNLGLSHTGEMDEDITGPHTPNIPSTMSYFCQVVGVKWKYEEMKLVPPHAHFLKNLDYSFGSMCTINENYLDERLGIGCRKVDWNCSGYINSNLVVQDLARDSLGGWCLSSGTRSALNDHNDWASIEDVTCLKSPEELNDVKVVSCITYEEFQQFKAEHPRFRSPVLEIEPCVANRMLWAIPSTVGTGGGWCDNPFRGFVQAYNSAWEGDILYLKYGTYDVNAPSVLLTKRMIITATDNALVRATGKGAGDESLDGGGGGGESGEQ